MGGVVTAGAPRWRRRRGTRADPPCDETDAGRAELAKTMDKLFTINAALINNEGNATIKRRKTNNATDTNFERRFRLSWLGFGLRKRVLVQPWDEMVAEPQMTAGIRLTELAKMMEQMSNATKPGESSAEHTTRRTGTDVLMGKRGADIPVISGGPAAVRAAFVTVPHEGPNHPAKPSNRLTGLVALLRSHIINAQRSNQYAKGLAPFLAKPDFGGLFKILPEAGYYHEYPDEWVSLVLEASGVPDTAAETPLFTGNFQFIQPDQMTALRKLTKRLWIFRLALDQVDLCTPAALERTNMKAAATDLYGVGALGARGPMRSAPNVQTTPRSSSSAGWPEACLARSGRATPLSCSTTCARSTPAKTPPTPARASSALKKHVPEERWAGVGGRADGARRSSDATQDSALGSSEMVP